jgi:glyoxylase-like metal-dependent hydrolase (beta-lactamase superfamily II)
MGVYLGKLETTGIGASMKPSVKEFFDKATWTLTYVVSDPSTKDAVIIDPVWDYDPASSKMSQHSAEDVLEYVKKNDFKVHYILETHAHADHVTGSQILKDKIPGSKVGIGANITEVQKVFKKVFNLAPDFKVDGSQFDLLIKEGEPFTAGSLQIEILFTPGHTPACGTYIIGDAVFTGDALFMPDYGTGRCDFPAGSADQLYHSVHDKIYKLPDHYRVFVGHDYQPKGRAMAFQSTIAEEKTKNIQLRSDTKKDQFVDFRMNRDRALPAPRLLLPSVQINIDAGHLPLPEANGARYLKIPIRES